MAKHTYDKGTANFRTIRNLRGYDDSERGFPLPEVDDTDYEDINVLVKRFMKGEIMKVGKTVSFDGQGSADDLIAKASPFMMDGADMSDVGPITDALKERAKARAKAKAEPKEPIKAPVPPSPEKGKEKASEGPDSGK